MKKWLAIAVFAGGTLLAGAAMAQPQAAPAQPMNNEASPGMAQQAQWQRNHQIGDLYTTALNTLYAHGFHGVQHLSLTNGEVQAMAVTPNGTPHTIMVNPETHQVSQG